jgi:hypothetical protein
MVTGVVLGGAVLGDWLESRRGWCRAGACTEGDEEYGGGEGREGQAAQHGR